MPCAPAAPIKLTPADRASAYGRPPRPRPPGAAVAGPLPLLALLALGLVSTSFAYVLFYKILARAGATNVSLVTLLVPVSATILGALVLGETLTLMQGLGMALIGVGLLVMDGRLVRHLRAA